SVTLKQAAFRSVTQGARLLSLSEGPRRLAVRGRHFLGIACCALVDPIAIDEFLSEFPKRPGDDRCPGLLHQLKIKMKVVQRDEPQAENLLRFQKMAQITAGELPAGGTGASRLDRRF